MGGGGQGVQLSSRGQEAAELGLEQGQVAPESNALKVLLWGHLGDSVVAHLPLAQAVIPCHYGIESHVGLPTGSLLLPLPVSLPLSVSSLMNK